jgi:hypothetical protein
MKEWWGLRVEPYASRKDVDSSSETLAMFLDRAMQVKSRPLRGERNVRSKGLERRGPQGQRGRTEQAKRALL